MHVLVTRGSDYVAYFHLPVDLLVAYAFTAAKRADPRAATDGTKWTLLLNHSAIGRRPKIIAFFPCSLSSCLNTCNHSYSAYQSPYAVWIGLWAEGHAVVGVVASECGDGVLVTGAELTGGSACEPTWHGHVVAVDEADIVKVHPAIAIKDELCEHAGPDDVALDLAGAAV